MTKSSCVLFLSVLGIAFISKSCESEQFDPPVLSTSQVVGVTSISAICGGEIIENGGGDIKDRGVCVGQSENPTTEDIKFSSGAGMGSFICTIKSLAGNTTYYVRAFASNQDKTGYGENISFTTPPTVTDIEGNIYSTVIIGDQTWMAENMKTTKYRNGDPITYIPGTWYNGYSNSERIGTIEEGAYCDYDIIGPTSAAYGNFYNWIAVSDSRSIAPEGWHVPTNDEWSVLIDYLGGEGEAAVKMRETGYMYWYEDCGPEGTNSSGFSARAAGFAGDDHRTGEARFWSLTEENDTIAGSIILDCTNQLYITHDHKGMGYSVRCVKN